MRIGMNLIPLRPGQMGGAEVYFRDLLAELLTRGGHEYVLVTADYNHDTLPADSPDCRRILFARDAVSVSAPLNGVARMLRGVMGGLREQYQRLVPEGARAVIGPVLRSSARARYVMSRGLDRVQTRRQRLRSDRLRELIERERLDLWFCPFTNRDPRDCPVPCVITVFDLQHEYLPEFFDLVELRHRMRFYPESCAAADHVIAISEYTRQSVIERYGIDPSRVTTIPLAAGSDFDWRDSGARVEEVRGRYALPPRYIFYPANTWHHKNHARLIEALARYRRETGEALTLVLTGVGKEGETKLGKAVERAGLRDSVRVLGFVPRADLPALYAGAACLVFASLFEGFGIPLAEAMLVGCPIAASDTTSIPEVVGDAAVLFDPRDPADIARAIAAVVRDSVAAAELVRRGRTRVERFSVSRTADLTLDLLDQVRREGLVRTGAPPAAGRSRVDRD
jgi:glycosyltransferase involved in cell wall biosynthesis